MVLRTRTSCSFRWRVCSAVRCDCRSTNISETSRFEYSISYILRLLAASSTENAQCGVLPSTSYLSTGLDHVALPAIHHAHNIIFRIIFGDVSFACLASACLYNASLGGGPDR